MADQRRYKNEPAIKIADIDTTKIVVGEKKGYKNSEGCYVPISYGLTKGGKPKPLSYQVRGLFCSGMKKKNYKTEDKIKKPKCWISVKPLNDKCEYVPGGIGDGKAFLKYQREIDKIITKEMEENKGKDKWNVAVGKTQACELISFLSENQKKKDPKTGKETNEVWDPSIMIPLSFKFKPDQKLTEDTEIDTKFINGLTKEEMKITPKNIEAMIPYRSFIIAQIEDSRIWLGQALIKIIRRVKEVKVLLPEFTNTESDDFIVANPTPKEPKSKIEGFVDPKDQKNEPKEQEKEKEPKEESNVKKALKNALKEEPKEEQEPTSDDEDGGEVEGQ